MALTPGDGSPEEVSDGPARRPEDERGAALVARATQELSARYVILQRVRGSGYWTVCAARDPARGGRVVLVSVIDRKALDEQAVAAVQRGLSWGRDIVHPHVVPVVEHGMTERLIWFATRGDLGRPLEALLGAEGRRSPSEALRLARQICSCLVLLHRGERSHGALCPSNILVDEKGRARIANLGVDAPVLRMRIRRGAGDPGEPAAYAAPEVLDGGAPTPAGDQYSAARILLECLHGSHPAEVPPALARALSERPVDRFPDITAFLNGLAAEWATAAPRPVRREPVRPPVVLVPAAPEPEEEPEPEAEVVAGGGLVLRGAATLITAGGLFGAFLVGQTAFAGVESPLARLDRDTLPSLQEESRSREGFLVYGPGDVERDTASETSPRPRDGSRVEAPASAAGEARGRRASGSGEAEEPSRPAPTSTRPPASSETPPAQPQRDRPAMRPPAPADVSASGNETVAAERYGRLFMNAYPWGTVYLDGRRIGNTPIVDFPLRPGTYVVRVEREGFQAYEELVSVEPGGELRRTGIVLERRPNA